MRHKRTYLSFLLVLLMSLVGIMGFSSAARKSDANIFLLSPPPDGTETGDTINLIYPFQENSNVLDPSSQSPIFLKPPSNILSGVEYDLENNEYIIKENLGEMDYRMPYTMSLDEYLKYDLDRSIQRYWGERSKAAGANAKGDGIIPQIYVGSAAFEKIFGSNAIDIRPQGSVELTFGVLSNDRSDLSLSERQRNVTNFDFQQNIQMSVLAKIGDNIEFQTNYKTEATFEFENKLDLKYEGKEDEIIQLIEAGNVTLPLNSTLIQGSQALFGVKTQLKFGRTTVTTVYSEQKSESSNITVEDGAQTKHFSLNSDQYEENKHYLLAQYFKNNYDIALATLPIVRSNINITKIEVWVTNIGAAGTENRNIIAFQDMGEIRPYNSTIPPKTSIYPDRYLSNDLMDMLMANETAARDINAVNNLLTGPKFYFNSGTDFVKVENARRLKATEYTFNSKLGFISLNARLNSQQTLAVAYRYNVIGDASTIFQVGEFSDEGIDSPKVLMVKLLKSTSIDTKVPLWDLMMKNVYAIGAYQVQRENFIMNILYSGNDNGVSTAYLTNAGIVSGMPLIRVLNFDNLDPQLNPPYDGIFDYIDNAATQGGTIQGSNGRIYFTCLQPFGNYLRAKIGDPELADRYAYDSLYTLTKNSAQQYPEKNKFLLEGFYKSSSGSEIPLNALNVPRGSVQVTAGGVKLIENKDYTVDYAAGSVKIINEGVLNSGTPINISMESQSLFNIQTKRLMGTHVDYRVNEDFNIGGTILNLTERPLTQKVNYGDEPISNTIWGMDFAYQTQSKLITKMVNLLPLISTKEESKVTMDGEFAHFIPGYSKGIGKSGTSYIDNFESSTSTFIDLKNVSFWFLASTPQKQTQPGMFPEAAANTGLKYGFNRALLSWYIIDPLFYDETGNSIPKNVDLNELSDNSVRQVLETEVFPNKETPNGIPTNIPVLNLGYFPSERGPYNYDVYPTTEYSAGINEDGSLTDPESRWGGIMRKIEYTNFEATNVGYIEFWMMDPFTKDQTNGGELYFNLGDISEDVLRSGRKFYENGLPTSADVTNVDTTIWGRVPTLQALSNDFSTVEGSRQYQDVGYDGLGDDDERSFFKLQYLDKIANRYGETSDAYLQAFENPSTDDYHYYRGSDYDDDPTYSSILNRYKRYNGPDGNSPTDAQNPESYPTAAIKIPNTDDISGNNTMNELERYFQYKVELDPNKMNVGDGYITDDYHAVGIRLANGTVGDVHWYQLKIPIHDPEKIVGGIQDFQSIRFLRMFMKGFKREIVLRFATLELVLNEWRKYRYDLLSPGEYIPDDIQSETKFDISAVNIEENGQRDPIPYVVPPGIEREINLGTTNLQQLNEQSMVLRVTNLIDGDARGAYKTSDFDFREYGRLQMFVHAEWMEQLATNKNGDLTVFVRIGSDLTENYYEYEIPMSFTPWGTASEYRDTIWPASNSFDIDLERLVNFKLQRNVEMRTPGSGVFLNKPYFAFDGKNKVTVLGSPTISEVKSIMIGVRNPKQRSFNSIDDGLSKSAIIWVDELRLADFNKQGGIAATAHIKADLADLGNVSLSGLYSTPGYGSIEKKTSERSQEHIRNFDFSTNLQLGKFFPERFGIRIPMHFDYSEARISPKYNQLDPDIILKDDLKTYDKHDQDSIESLNEDFVMRKNLNFINVRKNRVGTSSKSNFWDIENFNVTYSYSELIARNVDIKNPSEKIYRRGLGYIFISTPKNFKPFNKMKAFSDTALTLIKDINFTLLPKQFSFRTDMNRECRERRLRNKSQYDVTIQTTYQKKWDWNRNFGLKWDMATSLQLEYKVDVKAYIRELPGSVDYDKNRVDVKEQILHLGTKNLYIHKFLLNYTIPINKLPLLDWVNATALYHPNYTWRASPLSIQETQGNQIKNSNDIQLNGKASLDKLYDKVPFLKKALESGKNQGRQAEPRTPLQRKPGPEGDTTETKLKKNYFKIVGNGFLKILMGVKSGELVYKQGNETYLPNFMRKHEPGILGNDWGAGAPGLGFVFGIQKNILRKAVEWISADALLNTPYVTKKNRLIKFRATVEPLRDFKINISADRTYSRIDQGFYKSDGEDEFQIFSPTTQSSFSMSFSAWRSAWKDDKNQNKNENFETFKNNRKKIAIRLAKRQDRNWNHHNIDTLGYPVGYGRTQQDVLFYSFMSAYSRKKAENYVLEMKPKIPHLNWRVTYNGLPKMEFLKKHLQKVTLTHGYSCTYSVGSFQEEVRYKDNDKSPPAVDANNNFISQYQINQVSIMEQFSPLITFNMTWVNSLTTKFGIKKSRNLTWSFVNNQLTEVISNEFIIGTGYRFKNVKFAIQSMAGSRTRQNIKSDLSVSADFSIRSNKTVLRRIDEETIEVPAGIKVISINTSADYMVSQRVNIRLFFDKIIYEPDGSSQFRNSTTNGGVSLKFTLAQ